MSDPEIDAARRALSGRRVVVLTGAGVSTASGIPDYRSADAPPRSPMTFQQFMGDESYRRHYWARTYFGYQFMAERHPNAVHQALADWEFRAPESFGGIITQNIDTLHQRAGSGSASPVIDLHGRFDRALCMRGHRFSREFVQGMLAQANPGFQEMIDDVEIAPDADAVLQETQGFVLVYCPICGSDLRPDVVFFGETVPTERVELAISTVDQAQAALVLGSSLAVHSGLRYVTRAADAGKPVVIINRGETRGDRYAAVKIDRELTLAVPELASAILRS